ncbi:MAG: hypothetical protein WCF85_13015 [Rhodospirillaceae bacterium]
MGDASTTEVLQAIAALGERMERRFESIVAEQRQIRDLITGQREIIARQGERIATIEGHLSQMDKHLEYHGQVLAALIPTKIAAVGGR